MPRPLRVVLADDERPARRFLVNLLKSFPDVEIVGEASNGREALDLIEQTARRWRCSTCRCPSSAAWTTARLLKAGAAPLVAFVTAYDEFAVQAFELNAVDYLLKPVERDRLAATLDRARDRETAGDRLRGLTAASAAIEAATRRQFLERIPVRSGATTW